MRYRYSGCARTKYYESQQRQKEQERKEKLKNDPEYQKQLEQERKEKERKEKERKLKYKRQKIRSQASILSIALKKDEEVYCTVHKKFVTKGSGTDKRHLKKEQLYLCKELDCKLEKRKVRKKSPMIQIIRNLHDNDEIKIGAGLEVFCKVHQRYYTSKGKIYSCREEGNCILEYRRLPTQISLFQ